MSGFTVRLHSWTGEARELVPRTLELSSFLRMPARSLACSFAVDSFPLELVSADVLRGGRVVFSGKLDRQRTSMTEDGVILEIEARDKGAALLDNEARPRLYERITPAALFDELIAPFGFLLTGGGLGVSVPSLIIPKGRCLWDAFGTLCRLTAGLLPYVRGDMVAVARPASLVTVELGGAAHPLLELSHGYHHYRVLSRVLIRDEAGEYPTEEANAYTDAVGIARTRYYVPAGEYYASPRWDARQRIARSMAELVEATAAVPGVLEAEPGDCVRVACAAATLENLMVGEVTWRAGPAGVTTRLGLVSSVYL